MDEIKTITKEELQDISGSKGFDPALIVKDYYVTLILYLLKDIDGLYFKGGTALQKIVLNYSRLSEDVDYTVTKEIDVLKPIIENVIIKSGYFEKITKDKHVDDFVRLIVHYKDPFGDTGSVFIDLNKKAKLVLPPEIHNIPHFYLESIPTFSVRTLNLKEMIAEKMAATIGRNKPRDHFDLYKLISNNITIELDIVEKKCITSGDEFNIISMFKNAKKLKKRWDEDLEPLLSEKVTFQEVMKTLAKHFKYSEEKEKLKDSVRVEKKLKVKKSM